MTRFRIPIWKMMVSVVFIAVGFTFIKYPTEWSASLTYTVTLGILLFSLIGVAVRQGERQLFWIGFAVFGWGYFVHALRYGTLHPPDLIFSVVFDYFYKHYGNFIEAVPFGFSSSNPPSPIIEWFRQTANSMTALVVALIGSVLARFFGTKQDRTHPTGRD